MLNRELRLAICIPSNDTWKSKFGQCLVSLYAELHRLPVSGYQRAEFYFLNVEGSIICWQRQRMLELALARNATHALFLDSDMAFPPDLAHRLLQHGREIVACNYAQRTFPIATTCTVRREDGRLCNLAPTQPVGGLTQVDFAATGIMLIDLTVLHRIAKPWFLFEYDEKLAHPWVITEDFYFCRKAREAGYTINVDVDLSKEIGHVGQFEYRLDTPNMRP